MPALCKTLCWCRGNGGGEDAQNPNSPRAHDAHGPGREKENFRHREVVITEGCQDSREEKEPWGKSLDLAGRQQLPGVWRASNHRDQESTSQVAEEQGMIGR